MTSATSGASGARRSELETWLDGFVRDPSFLEAYPYYASILAKITPVADPSVQRMAISLYDGRLYLHVNVESFMAEPQFLRGVLLHEVHHVVLGHLTHPKFVDVEEPELMDLAVEMSANEYIEEPLPPAVTCRAYSAVGIRPGQSTRERYEILVEHAKRTGARPRPTQGENGTGTVDDHRFLARGRAAPGGVAQTAILVSRAVNEPRSEHEAGQEQEREQERDTARRFLLAGRTPERIVEELMDTTRMPDEPMDWRSALAMFAARARAPVHTWSRPSRRFPHRVFEVPGRSWSLRSSDIPHLLVAIDTSLSMTKIELEDIARQLVALSERAKVIVAECDAQVSRIYPFAGHIEKVTGRGGTDLRPIFEPEILGAHDIDGVVYFTDGDGPFAPEPPPVPTLWVLTKPSTFACPWGQRARLRASR
ncbi:VWA-like domain-containing protein [Pendulispora albinea]|uniref:VWA-like domain-containing protein n=1 Tax=Pendulispora albinea TaxID=2741071 RepID=A0ABZ2M6Y7_9BACT